MAVDLLENRANVIHEVHLQELQKYCDELAEGKFTSLEHTEAIVHNRVIDELGRRGCGIAEIEEEVHKLRLAIQQYFEKFHP